MTPSDFGFAIADIEHDKKGDGYWIEVTLTNGCTFKGGWQPVPFTTYSQPSLILLHDGMAKRRDYVPVESIVSLREID